MEDDNIIRVEWKHEDEGVDGVPIGPAWIVEQGDTRELREQIGWITKRQAGEHAHSHNVSLIEV